MKAITKNRHEVFNELVGKLFLEYHPKIHQSIHNLYHQHDNALIEQFIGKTNSILDLFKSNHEAMSVLDISYLFSLPKVKKYQFKIDGYNSLYYLDTVEKSSYFDYSILIQDKDEYFNQICKTVCESIKRVMDYEIQELEQYFMVIYFMVIKEVFSIIVNSDIFTDFLNNNKECISNLFYIKYGGYLDDNSILLREWRR